MAYFMWRDDGMVELMNEADPVLLDYFNMLPKMVEKTDIFRIVVCNMIGGVVSHEVRRGSCYAYRLDSQEVLPYSPTDTFHA